jgi:hypothetical protein
MRNIYVYLSLKDEKGFEMDINMSMDKQRNQASDAISKNCNIPADIPQFL